MKNKQLYKEAEKLLKNLDKDNISVSAYDTAWLARIPSSKDHTKPKFPETYKWVKENQHSDGSWGAKNVVYYHDRVLCTLSSIIAIYFWDPKSEQINKGIKYLNKNLKNLTKDHHETIGFELIFTGMIRRAEVLGMELDFENPIIQKYRKLRRQKLKKIPKKTLYKHKTTVSHSLEFLDGESNVDFKKLKIQQEINGSFGNSPSATAFYFIHTKEKKALKYIKDVLKIFKSGAPGIYPFEIFEKAWVIDNLELANIRVPYMSKRVLNYLYDNWSNKVGISISNTFSFPDLDDTSIVFKVLKNNNYDVSIDVFDFYQRGSNYVTFPYELNPSVSTYVHLLAAINSCEKGPKRTEITTNVLNFLKKNQHKHGYWTDKWHISPFYTTCHMLIELHKIKDVEMFSKGLEWLLKSQNEDGSWGWYGGSFEETGYALQVLKFIGRSIDSHQKAIYKAKKFIELKDNKKEVHLWVDKALYTPKNIIKSLIISNK